MKPKSLLILFVWFITAGICTILALFIWTSFQIKDTADVHDENYSYNTTILSIGSLTIEAEIADTAPLLVRGLSYRKELKEGSGMLFLFPEDGLYGFWMKDIHSPLDILWIDSKNRIVYIKENVSPDTYPELFTPPLPARAVLEIKAGLSGTHNLKIGDLVHFEKNVQKNSLSL